MVLGPVRGRRAQPSPSPLPAGDRAKTVGPRNLQTKRLGQAAAPVEAASATSVQVVARRAAGAEIVRTGVVVTPRGTVGARGDLIADRAGAAASRVVNARVCRASGHGGKVVGGAGGERGKGGRKQCAHWLHQLSHTASATPAATATRRRERNRGMSQSSNKCGGPAGR